MDEMSVYHGQYGNWLKETPKFKVKIKSQHITDKIRHVLKVMLTRKKISIER